MRTFGIATLIAGAITAGMLGAAAPALAAGDLAPNLPHYSVDNHDEVDTTNGFVDVPF